MGSLGKVWFCSDRFDGTGNRVNVETGWIYFGRFAEARNAPGKPRRLNECGGLAWRDPPCSSVRVW